MARVRKAETYVHQDEALLRPDVGTQAQFRKKKPAKTYRYDSSLSPAPEWDGDNSAYRFRSAPGIRITTADLQPDEAEKLADAIAALQHASTSSTYAG